MNDNNPNFNEDIQDVIQLLRSLHTEDENTRLQVVEKIRALNEEEVDILINQLRNFDGEIRCDAATALLIIDNHKYMESILPLLEDPLGYVRWDVAGLLHDFGDEAAIESLIKVILNDPDEGVRHNACFALSAIGDARALPALRHVLVNDKGEDYEGRRVSDMAKEAIESILSRQINTG
jgi:HEAT repeat protein